MILSSVRSHWPMSMQLSGPRLMTGCSVTYYSHTSQLVDAGPRQTHRGQLRPVRDGDQDPLGDGAGVEKCIPAIEPHAHQAERKGVRGTARDWGSYPKQTLRARAQYAHHLGSARATIASTQNIKKCGGAKVASSNNPLSPGHRVCLTYDACVHRRAPQS